MSAPVKWRPLFETFVGDLRIKSKEVSSLDQRGTPLVLWDSQKRFLDEVADGLDKGVRIFKCLKSRQLGVTTISLAIDLFWLAMHPNLTCALVVEKEENATKNRAVLKKYVNSFPDGYFGEEFRIVKGGDNRNFMEFTNGSRIDFKIAGVKDKGTAWGEGEGYAFAHLTEVASYGSAAGLKSFEESFAQQNPSRLFIYESTAKGFNHWRSSWMKGKDNPYTERSFFIGWWAAANNMISRDDPRFEEYGRYGMSTEERERVAAVWSLYHHKITPEQMAWIRWREDNLEADDDVFEQNQPWLETDAFVMSGYSFFQTRKISADMKELLAPENEDRYSYQAYTYDVDSDFFRMRMRPIVDVAEAHLIQLRVWEEPVKDAKYVIGADPAYGRNDHKDRHCASVWRCFADRLVQVAEFATADIEAKHFAWVLAHLAGAYEDCMINLEIGGPGRIVMLEWEHIKGLLNAEMNANMLKGRDWENALGMARWYMFHRPDQPGAGYVYNFETSWKTKAELMFGMRGAYATNDMLIRSRPMLEEMRIVVQNGNEIGAPESSQADNKDDRVFACALAIRAWTNWVRPSMIAMGQTYDAIMAEARGEMTRKSKSVNGIVYRFLLTQQEKAENADLAPTWRSDRGLS